jgi:general secretion pathway protein C
VSFYLKKYMWLISILGVALCAYFLARMTTNFIAMQFEGGDGAVVAGATGKTVVPIPERALQLEDFKPVVERNIFDSKYSPVVAGVPGDGTETPPEELNPTGEAVPSSLKAKLISTFVVGDGTDERSSAILSSGGKGGENVYTVNDKSKNALDIKLTKVQFHRIEFVNNGRLEYLELEDFAQSIDLNKPPEKTATTTEPTRVTREGAEEPKVEAKGETSFVIDRSEIDAAIANLDKLYTQVRAVPHFKDGKPSGLKLLSVRGDSLFAKLGLKRGDVLQRINGMELDIKKGLEIFNQLKSESKITMDIERREAPVTLEYEIR